MTRIASVQLGLVAAALTLPALVFAADAPKGQAKATSHTPRLYVAKGSTSASDLERLKTALMKLPGVSAVDLRPEFGAVTVTVEGDGQSTQSLLSAGARSAGYAMKDVQPRFFAADGSSAPGDLNRLKQALSKVYGVEQVTLGERTGGAAVKLLGVMRYSAVLSAAKSAGYEMTGVTAYVVSGSTLPSDLERLRGAVARATGSKSFEMQTLSGGATLLLHGDVDETALTAAAKKAGYPLWLLTSASGPRRFHLASGDPGKVESALKELDGIGKISFSDEAEGKVLSVAGGRVRPDAILAAIAEAGGKAEQLEAPVKLPTAKPDAGRSTPPDYDERVLEERAMMGQPAPSFTVLNADGTSKTRLSDLQAIGKPVVLIFGSCTCPRFINACPPLEKLYQAYKDRVNFQLVYIAEAHPGQILAVPNDQGEKELRVIPVIASQEESLANLRRLISISKLSIPGGIDTADKSINRDYAAYPNRIYVIGADGKIAYKGAPGPTGLKVEQLEAWLKANVK